MTRPDKVTLHRDDAQELLDALVSSLDFGSGFLSTEAVVALRNLATVLGVGQMDVTPTEYVNTHVHIPIPKTYAPMEFVWADQPIPEGWRVRETLRVVADPRERCKTCLSGNAARGSGELDASVHRPWVDDMDGHELAGYCRCEHFPAAHAGRCRLCYLTDHECRAYVDASVTL